MSIQNQRKSKYHVKTYIAQLGGQSKLYEGDVVARSEKDAIARFGYVIKTTKMGLASSAKVTVKPINCYFKYYF